MAEKVFGFGLRAFKKFPELVPLVTIVSIPCTAAVVFMGYSLYQKPDVTLVKSNDLPPFERVNPEERQKLITYNMQYKKIPELEALKREIGSYRYGK